jgi:alkylhydroperoxidase family enzyme
MGTPRIVPVTQEEIVDEDLRDILRQIAITGEFVPNVSTTMARNPGLFRPFLGFGEHFITKSNLPEREREMGALRSAHLSGSDYIFAHHAVIAKTGGLTDEEITRVTEGPDAEGWTDSDRAILRVVDELHATNDLGDAGWQVLAERWDDEQIVEFVIAVGFYTMMSMALNAFRTQIEPEISGGEDLRLRKSA